MRNTWLAALWLVTLGRPSAPRTLEQVTWAGPPPLGHWSRSPWAGLPPLGHWSRLLEHGHTVTFPC